MKIKIVTAMGEAATELAAFDEALINAGIANTNLIYLSSVIPPKAKVERVKKAEINLKDFGKRLYVVMAKRSSAEKTTMAAGLGWVMEKNGKFGLFVEHDGETEEIVRELIRKTLTDMMANRKKYEFTEIQYAISAAENTSDEAMAVVAAAVYQVESW